MELIISGYGAPPVKSIASFGVANGKFITENWSGSIDTPAFLCKESENGPGRYFAASERDDYSVFYIYKGQRQLDSVKLEGCGALCHIAYSKKHGVLYGGCYGTGNIRAAYIDTAAGRFDGLTEDYMQGGRVHSILINKDETLLYSANIAHDLIYVYNIDGGRLSISHTIKTGQGRGPRHMAFSPDYSLLYVITEYSNEILVFETAGGRLAQVISTLPAPTKEKSHCSALCFSPDGKKLYGANRFTDTIAEFEVTRDGTLKRRRWFGCGGNIPRHMIALSDGTLAVCNQESNSVDLIDAASGEKTDSAEFYKPAGIIEI